MTRFRILLIGAMSVFAITLFGCGAEPGVELPDALADDGSVRSGLPVLVYVYSDP